jgi:phage terminase large subunit
MDINFKLTKKQHEFISATADEVLYGGAAGGGKSYGQLIDAFLYALKYKGSKQLILRRTFPELERSLILVSLELFPQSICKYKENKHRWIFTNGSFIEFGYCDNEKDVTRYQGAEFDVIRFDELTHFTEFQYQYLISRIRGVNNYPKQIKCSTNPGGVGHAWVKARFIDNKIPGKTYKEGRRTRVFIPAKVQENKFLMDADPEYIYRLEQLPEEQRKALLSGEWDVFEGQYFTEFNKDIHVIRPLKLPLHWKRFRSLDYGLDMTACYWWAVDEQGQEYIYRELHESNLVLSDAAEKILSMTPKEEKISYTVASPDLWSRRQETGVSGAEIMYHSGLTDLLKADNNRINGWRTMREHLKPFTDEQDIMIANTRIFNTCVSMITSIPALIHDDKNPEDVSTEPHQFTHAADSFRYGVMSRPNKTIVNTTIDLSKFSEDIREDYNNASPEMKRHILKRLGMIK